MASKSIAADGEEPIRKRPFVLGSGELLKDLCSILRSPRPQRRRRIAAAWRPEIDARQAIAPGLIGQSVGRAGVIDIAQFDKELRHGALLRARALETWMGLIEVAGVNLPARFDAADFEDIPAIRPKHYP